VLGLNHGELTWTGWQKSRPVKTSVTWCALGLSELSVGWG